MPFCNAQNITDGLRYADENITGTARFNALSGAFGALGGDLSAIAINPAGSAVFLKNDAAASFAVSDSDNTTNYFNTVRESGDNEVSLNQAGMVFVFDNSENSNWKKFTLSLTYNNTQNFDDDVFAAGTGNLSIGSFFSQKALSLVELELGLVAVLLSVALLHTARARHLPSCLAGARTAGRVPPPPGLCEGHFC